MGDLALITTGGALVGLGWYWGGVADARTSAVVTGSAAVVLLGVTIFGAAGSPELPTWALAAVSGIWAGVITAVVRWEIGADRALGLYSLFAALAAILVAAALIRDADELTVTALGAFVVALVGGLIFISGALIPTARPFRSFVGWVTLIAGAAIAFLGFGPSLGLTL